MRRLRTLLLAVVAAPGLLLVAGHGHVTAQVPRAALLDSKVTLTLPAVRESFTLLACHRSTTIGLEGCAEHQVLNEDRHVNALQRQVFGYLHGNGARRRFVNADIDWIAYRRLTCLSDADAYQGGSFAAVSFVDCLAAVDRDRLRELSALKTNFVRH